MKGDGKMRIGEFAQKHNTTHDTIRHYLDMGLLITEKKGGHYRFDESDSWDLENIIELKSMGFFLIRDPRAIMLSSSCWRYDHRI